MLFFGKHKLIFHWSTQIANLGEAIQVEPYTFVFSILYIVLNYSTDILTIKMAHPPKTTDVCIALK